jgi:hypothetical protein
MPTTIHNMPNEVLKHILVQVREQGGYDAIRMALLVSRLWNNEGSPVLYEHVVLSNANISSFLTSNFDTHVNIWAVTDQLHMLTCYGHKRYVPANGKTCIFLVVLICRVWIVCNLTQLNSTQRRRLEQAVAMWDVFAAYTLRRETNDLFADGRRRHTSIQPVQQLQH